MQVIAQFPESIVTFLLRLCQLFDVLFNCLVHQKTNLLDLIDGQRFQLIGSDVGQVSFQSYRQFFI